MGCNTSNSATAQPIPSEPPQQKSETPNYYLEKSQLSAVKKLFGSLDKNNEGKITPDQAVDALKQFGITTSSEVVQKLTNLVDDNNDGYIQEIEFLRLYICMLLHKKDDQDQMMLYVAADQNMDGKIQHHELLNCCEKLDFKSKLGEEVFTEVIQSRAKNAYTRTEYFEILDLLESRAK